MTYDPKNALIGGIFAKWNGGSLANDIAPLQRSTASTNVSRHPYSLLIPPENLIDLGMTCGTQRFECELELAVYDKSPELVAAHKQKIDQVFSSDALSLQMDGASLESCRLTDSSDNEQDDNLWRGGLVYRFRISRTRIA